MPGKRAGAKDPSRELRVEVRKTVRETVEEWISNRHWFWLVLIVVVSAGYVEIPNLPVFVDDWVFSVAGAAAAFELVGRVRRNRDAIKTWILAVPGRVRALVTRRTAGEAEGQAQVEVADE